MTPLPVVPTADGDDYPPLSALNDLLFCTRRCFMHRVEGVWVENVHTTSGTLDHRRVHASRDAEVSGKRIARALPLVSHRLRIVGVSDLVEFQPDINGPDVPFPVEYKRGKKRKWDNDEVQLCAQAICLEEMLGVVVPAGAIFHVKSKHRRDVSFTPALRKKTEDTANRLHALLATRTAPPPVLHPKCKQCSLHRLCMPELLTSQAAYRKSATNLFKAE
ncbi:MAG: CRISPR-associated protein Cas4 [Planctomycetaceae bacterium]|nr:CRISPR-associated protein Cas4 [Planctomycetaceae bacterium]